MEGVIQHGASHQHKHKSKVGGQKLSSHHKIGFWVGHWRTQYKKKHLQGGETWGRAKTWKKWKKWGIISIIMDGCAVLISLISSYKSENSWHVKYLITDLESPCLGGGYRLFYDNFHLFLKINFWIFQKIVNEIP